MPLPLYWSDDDVNIRVYLISSKHSLTEKKQGSLQSAFHLLLNINKKKDYLQNICLNEFPFIANCLVNYNQKGFRLTHQSTNPPSIPWCTTDRDSWTLYVRKEFDSLSCGNEKEWTKIIELKWQIAKIIIQKIEIAQKMVHRYLNSKCYIGEHKAIYYCTTCYKE